MDIVFVNQTFGLGGAETFNISLANYLSKSSNLHFYTNNRSLHKLTVNLNSQFIPFSVDFIGDWKGFLKGLLSFPFLQLNYIYIIIKNNSAQTYYFTGYIEKILLTPWLKFLGKKVVWVEFGPLNTIFNKFWHFPEFLYRLVSGLPDKVIFSSQNSSIQNQQYYPTNTNLTVIPLGSPIPPVRFSKVPKFDVLCLSRLEPGKGQDLLIKAWVKVAKVLPKATLYIAGTGDNNYFSQLKTLIGSQKNIYLLGRVEDKYAYLKSCKLTVFPSVWPLEGFGLVITESLSMGKPVVAFDHPPGNEIIKSGYNGLLSGSLSENIIYLLKNPKVLQKLSQNARLSFEKSFREDIYLKSYASAILS